MVKKTFYNTTELFISSGKRVDGHFILLISGTHRHVVYIVPNRRINRDLHSYHPAPFPTFFFFFSNFISLIADGPHHYHPACGHKGSSHLSPVHALQFFYRDASSALLQLVNLWLNFTYSRSHAFRYERKNTNPTLVRIELTTSVLADVQLTY